MSKEAKAVEIDWEALEAEAEEAQPEEDSEDKAEETPVEAEADEGEDEPESPEDEKKKFGERAQKRIQRLVAQRRQAEEEAKKAREEAEEARREAAELRKTTKSTEDHALTQQKARLDVAEEALKAKWSAAADKDDRDEMWEINRQLARVESERILLETYEGQRAPEPEPDPEPEEKDAKPSPPPVPEVVKNWADKNTWFGRDEDMTKKALEIDAQLLAEGFDPTEQPAAGEDSNEYLNELQARLAKTMPDKFGGKKKTSPVGGATRSTTQRKTKSGLPRLTQSEIDLAHRLGITPKAYAEQKKRLSERGA